MAYISTQQVAEMRRKIKDQFPSKDGWKFSIRRDHRSTLRVSILEAPVRFSELDHCQLNHYYVDRYENSEFLEKIRTICMTGNHDNSDIQSDYFDVGWYLQLEQGQWDKPFKLTQRI